MKTFFFVLLFLLAVGSFDSKEYSKNERLDVHHATEIVAQGDGQLRVESEFAFSIVENNGKKIEGVKTEPPANWKEKTYFYAEPFNAAGKWTVQISKDSGTVSIQPSGVVVLKVTDTKAAWNNVATILLWIIILQIIFG